MPKRIIRNLQEIENQDLFHNSFKKTFNTNEHNAKWQALRITSIYFLTGCLWVLLANKFIEFFINDRSMIFLISILKGWVYVFATSVLIFLLVFTAIKRVIDAKDKIETINTQLKEKNDRLDKSNTLFLAILESSPEVIIFVLDSNYCYLAFNKKHKDTIQQIFRKEIGIGINMLDIIRSAEDRSKAKANFDSALAGKSFSLTDEYGDETLSRIFWQNYYSPILSGDGRVIGLTCFVLDITDQVQTELSLRENERLLRQSQNVARIGSFEINLKTETWKGSTEINEILGIDETYSHTLESWVALIHPDLRKKYLNYHVEAITEKKRFDHDYKIIRVTDGIERWVHEFGELELDNQGNVVQVIGTIQDITKRKKADEDILYLSYHDKLTGLYNRGFYEEEIKRLDTEENLPISIIIADVNGLKLFNDAFGHDKGDELLQKAALAVKSVCRTEDVAARWGGDEFVILLPKTKIQQAEEITQRIKSLYSNEHVNALSVSISFGWDTKSNREENILKILNNAEDFMFKNKIIENVYRKGNTIATIISTLHEKNPREEQHSKRVGEICQFIGKSIGLSEHEIRRLRVAGHLHDIGKIAIEESILNKPGKLTEQEREEIKHHPEIGYRILNASCEMSDLANGILLHHERWDGAGYPKGLIGEAIPIVSRIIGIADSYDAMTSERTYRNALSEETVLAEIRNNAGLQFDPEIARVFIEKVLNKPWD
jgi:diguanylate cyclase (GGDEF)-like protein/PAS domain S-box-containing protein